MTDTIEKSIDDSIEQIVKDHADEARAREDALEEDVIIAAAGNYSWAVVSMTGAYRLNELYPWVIHARLESHEAAEVARHVAIILLADTAERSAYGPSDLPVNYYNTVGRVLTKLRAEGVKVDDLVALAVGITDDAAAGLPKHINPFEKDTGDQDFVF
jgi:hypothetical protein